MFFNAITSLFSFIFTFFFFAISILFSCFALLLFIGLCSMCLFGRFIFYRSKIKLILGGLPELKSDKGKSIQSVMDSLSKKGLNEADARPLISRIEWWNKINLLVNSLTENQPELLDNVVNDIKGLVGHHGLERDLIEADLTQIIVNKALEDSSKTHLLAHLFHRLIESQTSWTQSLGHRLFQIIVKELNTLSDVDKKNNAIQLMAAIFKRRVPGVPDDWITDTAEWLIKRFDADIKHSSQQLCLFLSTILVNEHDDDCNLLPSQQRQLLPCVKALEKAILGRKFNKVVNVENETETDPDNRMDLEWKWCRRECGN
ncbi:Uncharacterized protein APZ42_013472 [Daphnia magna]|uniref:Uncharacterized protein n=1 Tax=Daphnia magna TaxID=35525 RepID=A0A0P6CE76_9CRUS|nr:Uncharacterized protein APZ42_013472 [Daphnia magna]